MECVQSGGITGGPFSGYARGHRTTRIAEQAVDHITHAAGLLQLKGTIRQCPLFPRLAPDLYTGIQLT